MAVNINDITITSLETITAFDTTSGAFLFALDEPQNASIAQGQETTDITGKGGRKLSTLKRNKSITISGANGLVSGGLMEVQTGGKFQNKTTTVKWSETLTVNSNEATTAYTAVGTAGAEIEKVYVRNSDGTLGTALTQDSTAASGKFAYAPATKKLTFSGITDGTEIVVFYNRTITANVLVNESDKYSTKATLYIDALAEDKCDNIYRVQFYIPKADFSGEFTLEMGGDQTVHNFEAQALAGACGAAGNLYTYTVFGANTADAAVSGSY